MAGKHPYTGPDDPRRFHQDPADRKILLSRGNGFDVSGISSIIIGGDGMNTGGYGKFGCVHTNEDGGYDIHPTVGIKVFEPAWKNDGEEYAKTACAEEYKMLCELFRHGGFVPEPYAVGTFDWAPDDYPRDGGTAYPAIIMERLEASDLLAAQGKSGALFGYEGAAPTPERVLEIGLVIARAIETCHLALLSDGDIGIVHRDLSPRNIFIHLDPLTGDPRRVTLIDFGQSVRTSSQVSSYGRPAALAYASPEMFRQSVNIKCPDGSTLYSHRNEVTVDIWSFGAILYTLRTEKRPHGARHDLGQYDPVNVKRDYALDILNVVEPSGLDGQLDALIQSCTQFYPSRRPQSMSAVVAEIESMLGLSEPEPAPDPQANGDTPPVGRHGNMTGQSTPPIHSHKAESPAEHDGEDDDEDPEGDAIDAFANEFNMSYNEVFEQLAPIEEYYDSYADALEYLKWQKIALDISSDLKMDPEAVYDMLPSGVPIPAGDWKKILDESKKRMCSLVKAVKKRRKQTFTVTYRDGADGVVFEEETYKVKEGDNTPPLKNPIPKVDGYVQAGWDKEIEPTVEHDVIYTMHWEQTNLSKVKEKIGGLVGKMSDPTAKMTVGIVIASVLCAVTTALAAMPMIESGVLLEAMF